MKKNKTYSRLVSAQVVPGETLTLEYETAKITLTMDQVAKLKFIVTAALKSRVANDS